MSLRFSTASDRLQIINEISSFNLVVIHSMEKRNFFYFRDSGEIASLVGSAEHTLASQTVHWQGGARFLQPRDNAIRMFCLHLPHDE